MRPGRPEAWRDALGVGGALVLALVAVAMSDVSSGERATAAAVAAIAVAPLWWRRRAPSVALTVIATAGAVAFLVDPLRSAALEAVFFVALAFGTYALGRHESRGLPATWAGLAVVAVVALAGQSARLDGESLATLVWLAVPFLVARTIRYRQADVAELRERVRLSSVREAEATRLAVERERLAIAREVHDVVAHSVAAISLQSSVALHVFDEHPGTSRTALEHIRTASTDALHEVRGMLGMLRSTAVDEADLLAPAPGLDAIGTSVTRARALGLRVELVERGGRRACSPVVERTVARIVQEAITNVIRHAKATQAWIDLDWSAEAVSIRVRDDGTSSGSTERDDDSREHYGIAGMCERAALIGGRLTAGPAPEGGYTVQASIPLRP